jgi:hypothetical protein
MVLDQIAAQLAQRPTPIGQPNFARRLIGQLHDRCDLGRGQSGRDTRGPQLFDSLDSGLLKRVHIGVDRVSVHALGFGDHAWAQSHPVQDQRFGPALAMRICPAKRALPQSSDLTSRGPADFQRTSHGNASLLEACHSNND